MPEKKRLVDDFVREYAENLPPAKPFLLTLEDLASSLQPIKWHIRWCFDDEPERTLEAAHLASDFAHWRKLLHLLDISDCPLTSREPQTVSELLELIDETLPWIQQRLVDEANSNRTNRTEKKTKKKNSPRELSDDSRAVAEALMRARLSGDRLTKGQAITDYCEEHPNASPSSISRELTDNPGHWRE